MAKKAAAKKEAPKDSKKAGKPMPPWMGDDKAAKGKGKSKKGC